MRKLLCTCITIFLVNLLSFSQTWEPTSAPPNFLTDHSFGFGIDGRGYLVAGTTEFEGPTNRFLEYHPFTDTWEELDTFPGAARGYGIGDIWDRKAYFGFGVSATEMLNDLWVYDPDSSRWTELDTCPCQPRLHPAMVALDGKIFVGLGNNSNGNLKDWWEYDIASNEWSQRPDFPGSVRHHPYQFAANGYVYTGFGHGNGIFNDWYRYDPNLQSWFQVASLPDEGRVAGTQFSYDNKGYVLSGDGDDHTSMEEGEFWSYDPDQDAWTQLPPHPGRSRWAPASFLIGGVVYLFNGTTLFEQEPYFYQSEAYKFDLEALISSNSEVESRTNISVYPNPAKGEIYLNWDNNISDKLEWKIIDVEGRVLKSGHVVNSTKQIIDVSGLPSGAYYLITDDEAGQLIISH